MNAYTIAHSGPQNQFETPPAWGPWYIRLIWRNQFKLSLWQSDGWRPSWHGGRKAVKYTHRLSHLPSSYPVCPEGKLNPNQTSWAKRWRCCISKRRPGGPPRSSLGVFIVRLWNEFSDSGDLRSKKVTRVKPMSWTKKGLNGQYRRNVSWRYQNRNVNLQWGKVSNHLWENSHTSPKA